MSKFDDVHGCKECTVCRPHVAQYTERNIKAIFRKPRNVLIHYYERERFVLPFQTNAMQVLFVAQANKR